MYKSGWAGGGGGRAGGLREPETQAAQPSAQELTETATVGLDDGKGRGGHREVISPAVTITALKRRKAPLSVKAIMYVTIHPTQHSSPYHQNLSHDQSHALYCTCRKYYYSRTC